MPELRQVYVGIDVHQERHIAAVIPLAVMQHDTAYRKAKVLPLHNRRADFDALHQAIQAAMVQRTIDPAAQPLQAAIAIDHTGGHYSAPLVHYLTTRGYRLHYMESKALRSARNQFLDEENKDDKTDARGMARMLYLQDVTGEGLRISLVAPSLDSVPTTLRSLIQQRAIVHKLATRCTNQLRQLLTSTFPEVEGKHFDLVANRVLPFYPTPQAMLADGLGDIKYLGAKRQVILDLARDTVGIPADHVADAISTLAVQRLAALQQSQELEDRLVGLIQDHPYTPILLSFPGLGHLAAAAIIGATRDISRWRGRNSYRKALGIYVTIAQSGKHKGERVMGREGSAQARTALYRTVFGLLAPQAADNPYRRYHHRLVARGMKAKPAIVACCNKLATHIYAALSRGEPYRWQPPHGAAT